MWRRAWARIVAAGFCLTALGTASAQQATVSTPYHSVGDSFFENIGTSWEFRGKGFDVRFGGPTMAAPPFGRFNPAAGANLGFGFGRNGAGGFFDANFSQGSQRSMISQTPCITVTDGVPGYMAAGTMTPFVISYVPVVGGGAAIPAVFLPPTASGPVMPPTSSGVGADAVRDALRQSAARAKKGVPATDGGGAEAALEENAPQRPVGNSPAARLARAQESAAGQPVPSVREAARLRAAEEASLQAEAQVHFERGLRAEEAGNLAAAKAYYQMAARRATGDLQDEVRRRLGAVARASKPAAE